MTRRIPFALGALLLLLLGSGLGGCGQPRHDEPIVVVGFDSADWTWIDPLMDEGRMPHFQSLQNAGVRADLMSLVPLQKSPTIWTSIATGKRPVKHGIADFITRKEKVQTSDLRQSAAYWDVLGALGHRQAVLGWWVTFPATEINGVLVSDFVPYLERSAEDASRAVYPPELWSTIDSLRVRPEDLHLEDLERFVDLDVAREHGDEAWELLKRLREYVANDRTYLNIARWLYPREPFQCFTVYFRGLDMVSHEYWEYFEPRRSGLSDDDWRVRMLHRVVPEYYVYADELLGDVLEMIDPTSRVLVLSDHGFKGHRQTANGPTLGVNMHREEGVLLMKGPGILEGERLDEAEVKDIMPTLLLMSGVPLAKDIDGHPLVKAFDPSERRAFEKLEKNAVESYDSLRIHGDGRGASEEVDAKLREQLKSLGYLD